MIRPRSLTSLTLFFPCYNEALNVGSMVDEAVRVAESYGADYEVLVVDDGSKDETASIVLKKAQANPRVRLISHEKNQGYGAALRSGLQGASKDLVFLTDGDNQFRIADIDKLFSKIDGCDVVAGYRISRQDKPHRRLNGFLWTQLNKVLFGIPVRDVDCAFKLFRRTKLQGLKMESNQLLVHAEIIARLARHGCRIEEIGIDHYPRTAGKASATNIDRIFKTFGELFRLFWSIQKDK